MTGERACYRLFDLNVRSALPLGEAIGSPAAAHVRIALGPVPDRLQAPAVRGLRYEVGPDECLVRMDGIADFHVQTRDRLTVRTNANATPADIGRCLLGTPMAALLYARGHLLLNGACILTTRGAVVLTGSSGSGASTLAAALCQAGADLVSDGFCALATTDGIQVLPGPLFVRLAPDSLVRLGVDPDGHVLEGPGARRHILPMAGVIAPVPLRAIVVLSMDGGDRVRFAKAGPQSGLLRLEREVHRPHLARPLLGQGRYFEHLASIIRHIDLYFACRPRHWFDPAALADAVLQTLEQEEPTC